MPTIDPWKRIRLSLPSTIPLVVGSVAGLHRAPFASSGDGGPSLAGGGGSELPWWSPIFVTVLLFTVSFFYRRWDRARTGRAGKPGSPEGACPAAGEDGPPSSGEGAPGAGASRPGGPLVSRAAPRLPGVVDARPLSV